MRARVPVWSLGLLLLVLGGLAVAQGFQDGVVRSFFGPVTVSGALTATGALTASTITTTAGSGTANITIPSGGRLYLDGTRYLSGGASVDVTGGVLQATSGFVTANAYTSSATSGNQFACSGAATCNLASASGQGVTIDSGGGTSTINIGSTNATTVALGRTGQTTTINGNVTFGSVGPNLGTSVTGTWGVFASGALTATTNYGALFTAQDVTNLKFQEVTCTHGTAGTGTAGTLAIRNVTDSTTLCSGSYTCTTTANTPTLIFTCNAQPTKSKLYALQFTAGCGTTQVSNLNCSVTMTH